MTAFFEGEAPIALARGVRVEAVTVSDVVTLASGREIRNAPQRRRRRRYDVGGALLTWSEIAEVLAFFEARRGRWQAFRFRDPFDDRSAAAGAEPGFADEVIGAGDGVRTAFPLTRTDGDPAYPRRIFKPVAGSVRVGVGGAERTQGFVVDHTEGRIMFDSAPAAGAEITAGFEFHTPVRFDADRLEAVIEGRRSGRFSSIPLLEVTL